MIDFYCWLYGHEWPTDFNMAFRPQCKRCGEWQNVMEDVVLPMVEDEEEVEDDESEFWEGPCACLSGDTPHLAKIQGEDGLKWVHQKFGRPGEFELCRHALKYVLGR